MARSLETSISRVLTTKPSSTRMVTTMGVRKDPVVHNKVGDKIGNDTDNEGYKSGAFEPLCLSRPSEQLSSVFERFL